MLLTVLIALRKKYSKDIPYLTFKPSTLIGNIIHLIIGILAEGGIMVALLTAVTVNNANRCYQWAISYCTIGCIQLTLATFYVLANLIPDGKYSE